MTMMTRPSRISLDGSLLARPAGQTGVAGRKSGEPDLVRRAVWQGALAAPLLLGGTAAAFEPPAGTLKTMRVRRLAWAGILVEVGEVALYVDAVAPEPKDQAPATLLISARPQKFAAVTHYHGDHFENATIRTLLGESGLLVATRETVPYLDTRGLKVQAVETWQPIFFPRAGSDIVAFPVPAVDGFGSPQCSWIVDGGNRRIFHGGDTQWHGLWTSYGRAYGPFDAAFLPINGARQNFGRFRDNGIPAVLTPEQAVIAAQELGARRLVPIHYGAHDPPGYSEIDRPLERLRAAASSKGVEIVILAAGETVFG